MDSDFCRNCEKMSNRLIENTCRGSRGMLPFRTVFVQLLCGNKVFALEPVGQPELVDEDYAMLCHPGQTCSNIIDRKFLSKQMDDDYDNALERAFKKIDCYCVNDIPEECEYMMEQELSNMNEDFGNEQ